MVSPKAVTKVATKGMGEAGKAFKTATEAVTKRYNKSTEMVAQIESAAIAQSTPYLKALDKPFITYSKKKGGSFYQVNMSVFDILFILSIYERHFGLTYKPSLVYPGGAGPPQYTGPRYWHQVIKPIITLENDVMRSGNEVALNAMATQTAWSTRTWIDMLLGRKPPIAPETD